MPALASAHGVARVHLWTHLGRALGYTVRAYLTRGVLVDTGFPRAARAVGALLARERPRAVVVTHAHEDRAGNVALAAALGIPVVASADTLARLRTPAPLPLYQRLVWGTPAPLPAASGAEEHPALAEAGLVRLAAPGHAPDHSAVRLEERMDEVARLARAGVPEHGIRRRVLGREAWVAMGSRGEYAKLNLVRAALADPGTAAAARQRSHGIFA
jgi:hypothetical protein